MIVVLGLKDNLRVVGNFLFLGFCLMITVNSYAEKLEIISSWFDEGPSNDEGIPLYVFTINLTQVDHKLIGEYCYVSNYGKRDDCNNPIRGKKISTGLYQVDFNSSFGGKNGLAEIKFLDKKMYWIVHRFPRYGAYSIPKESTLVLD